MESDLNKEMEVLLRRARESGSSLPAGPHLDPDMISAFAANAVPEVTRPAHVSHLADCSRCRTILAELISHTEAAQDEPARILVPAHAPWYARLFELPKTTYAAAALVVIFGAIAVFFVTQNLRQGGSEISRTNEEVPAPIKDAPAVRAPESAPPAVAQEPSASEPGRNGTNATAQKKEVSAPPVKSKEVPEPPTVTADAAPPPAPVAASAGGGVAANEIENDSRRPSARKAEPMAAPSVARAPGEVSTVVNGRTFIKKDGVWTDAAYSGEATVSVRRGSEEFDRLDSDLKGIAAKLSGTLIVVWNGRAYRIK